ncbi:hypothetical protein HC031_11455 [Planosporangium thailandense]|uniref:Thrombospondin n=1 Tax=Planosporangium thailandense TaxID=765197 RepID=A0ABX0XW99_9ACTN|nr:hypothetical protein [Planosporangium thailandense]NJC70322.1 hypothetical protein [Planosporangium thailandense]
MATDLSRRQAADERAADDTTMRAGSTTGDVTRADRERDGLGDPTVRLARVPSQPVPPGGAVAPMPPGGRPVPPGGAVEPPPDATRPLGTGPAPAPGPRHGVDAEADRDSAEAERDHAEAERDHAAAVRARAETDRLDADRAERADVTDADADTAEPVRPARWAHTSFTATLSLIVGVCATLGALSGRLAPLGVVAGAVGLLLAAIGLAAVSRRHVTGHHVALLGLVFSIAGVVLGILAMTKSLPWLDSGADNVARLRGWLDAHWSWMRRW